MNKKSFTLLVFLFSFVVLSHVGYLFATPAYPGAITYLQPDQTSLTLFLKGDEWVHWGETEDGYRLLVNKDNGYVYAEPDGKGGMQPSAFLAHNKENRTLEEKAFLSTLPEELFFSSTQLSVLRQYVEVFHRLKSQQSQNTPLFEGTFRIAVVLMAFTDQAFTYTREDFDALFNQTGYSTYGNNGSVRDYFRASSNGLLNLEATVLGPYTAAHDMAYYGAHSQNGDNDVNARGLIIEAVDFAAADVDMRQFDNSGRGLVDAFYVIYAGFAESSGGGPNTIWPHRWALYPPKEADGVQVVDYGCSSERQGTPAQPTNPTIGTICHEFSHVLTLPDFYDTDYGNSGGQAPHPGAWDLMAGGNYNNGGKCPPLWSAWERESVGWMRYDNIETLNDVTLFPIHSHNQGIKIPVQGNPNEYFLLENRQKSGFDAYLPSQGMLIIHVNENVSGWNSNCANCNPNSLGYRIIPADNSSGQYTYEGFTYPGSSNNHSFTDNSVPAAQTVSGSGLGKPITNITQHPASRNISFEYCQTSSGRAKVETGAVLRQTATSCMISGNVTSQGSSNVTARGVVYGTNTNPTLSDTGVAAGSGAGDFSVTLTNLSSGTQYYARAYATNASGTTYGQTIAVKLPCVPNNTYPCFVTFEDGKLPDCWFTEKVGNNSEVATWICLDTIATFHAPYPPYGGKYAVFLEAANGLPRSERLISVPVDLSSLQQPTLQFHYIQPQGTQRAGELKIYYRTSPDQPWTLLQTYSAATSEWTEQSLLLPNASAGYQIAFEGKTYRGAGIGLDNIVIMETHPDAIPSVNTEEILGVGHTEAVLSGNVLSSGSTALIERGFCWNTKGRPTLMDQYRASGNGQGRYSSSVDSLAPSTTYYIRAYAKNATAVVYGEERMVKTFCTPQLGLPFAETFEQPLDRSCLREEMLETETIHWTRLRGNGDNQPPSAVADSYNYCYKTTSGTHRSKLVFPILNIEGWSSVKIKFYHTQAPLMSHQDTLKVYYKNGIQGQWILLRTYSDAVNTWTLDSLDVPVVSDRHYLAFEGIAVGGAGVCIDNMEVTGYYPLPILHTLPVSNVSDHSFVAHGKVLFSGQSEVLEKGFCYGTTPRPTTANEKRIVRGSPELFSDTIQNLQSLSTYYIRAYATNQQGTAYGEEITVRTAPERIIGNIIQGNQGGCLNSPVEPLSGSVPTGGYGNFSYLWLQSSDSVTWDTVEFFTQANLQNYIPERLSVTTYFCRVVFSGAAVDTSNVVKVAVYYPSRGGNVFRSEDTVLLGNSTSLELRAFRGNIIKWEARQGELNWQVIDSVDCSSTLTTTPTAPGKWQYRAWVQNGDCNPELSGMDEIWVKKGVDLEQMESIEETSVVVVPNPNNGKFELKVPKKENLKLYIVDMQGRLVFEKAINHLKTNKINVEYLDDGYYTLEIVGDDFIMTKKLIILKSYR